MRRKKYNHWQGWGWGTIAKIVPHYTPLLPFNLGKSVLPSVWTQFKVWIEKSDMARSFPDRGAWRALPCKRWTNVIFFSKQTADFETPNIYMRISCYLRRNLEQKNMLRDIFPLHKIENFPTGGFTIHVFFVFYFLFCTTFFNACTYYYFWFWFELEVPKEWRIFLSKMSILVFWGR